MKLALREVDHRMHRPPELPKEKTRIPLVLTATVFPMPVAIAGAMVDGRPNFITLVCFGLISPIRPNPIIYISTSKTHYSNIGIKNNKAFSVNIPSKQMLAQTDYLGVVSGRTVDKSNVMTVFYGRRDDAPCLLECPLNYVCKLIQHIPINEKDLFIGEIVESYITSAFYKKEKIDIEAIEPLIFTTDLNYRVPSSPVGKAFNDYRLFRQKP